MVYSDSHSHLDSYPPENLESVFAQMNAKHVDLVLNVGTNLKTSENAIRIAHIHDNVFAAVGIHPGMAVSLSSDIKAKLEELTSKPKVVALGEIGIEYHGPGGRPLSNMEIQKELFIYQLSIARNIHLPVNIHYSMDAQADIIEIIHHEKSPSVAGIAHAFQGTLQDLQAWLDIGFYISVGAESLGIWKTIKDAPPLTAEVVVAIPEDRLLTETDSMFWGGMPSSSSESSTNRTLQPSFQIEYGTRQPADVLKVTEKIAMMRGVSKEAIGNMATENLKRVLKLQKHSVTEIYKKE